MFRTPGRHPTGRTRRVTSNGDGTGAIDAHGHCIPQSFLDEVVRTRAFGVETQIADGKYVMTFPGRKALRPISGAMVDSTDRNPWLADQEIGHQIVAPWLDVHGQ